MAENDRGTISLDTLDSIGRAIQEKLNTQLAMTPAAMPEAIRSIETGITPTGTINITQNGTVDVTQYASANVDVSGGILFNSLLNNCVILSRDINDTAYGYDGISAERWFTRTSNEPVIVLPCQMEAGFSGYGIIYFTENMPSGTYNQYGNIVHFFSSYTPAGTPYNVAAMYGMFPSARSVFKFNRRNGAGADENIRKFKISEIGFGLWVNGTNAGSFNGATVAQIDEINAAIDSVYQNYYAGEVM